MPEAVHVHLCPAEKYLREVWPAVTRALKEMGVGCELNLVSNCSGGAAPTLWR